MKKKEIFKEERKNNKRGKNSVHVCGKSAKSGSSHGFLIFLKKNHPESEKQDSHTSLRSTSSIIRAVVSDSHPVFRPTCLIYLNVLAHVFTRPISCFSCVNNDVMLVSAYLHFNALLDDI